MQLYYNINLLSNRNSRYKEKLRIVKKTKTRKYDVYENKYIYRHRSINEKALWVYIRTKNSSMYRNNISRE